MSWISEFSWQGDRYRPGYSWCGVGVGVGVQSGWDCITEADSDGSPALAVCSLLNAPNATGNTQRAHNATTATDSDLFGFCEVDAVFIDDGQRVNFVTRLPSDKIFLARNRNSVRLAWVICDFAWDCMPSGLFGVAWTPRSNSHRSAGSVL